MQQIDSAQLAALLLGKEAEGGYNPGAVRVALELADAKNFTFMGALLYHHITGSKLWELYADKCNHDLEELAHLTEGELEAFKANDL